jgi:hypothetical protein
MNVKIKGKKDTPETTAIVGPKMETLPKNTWTSPALDTVEDIREQKY